MKRRRLVVERAAEDDLFDAWFLVASNDGTPRADRFFARIEAFLFSLQDFAGMGTPHPRLHPGLRSTGVPGLKTFTVLFVVTDDAVTVIRISYLGRDVWTGLPRESQ